MIFKLVKFNKYTLLFKAFSQTLCRNIHLNGVSQSIYADSYFNKYRSPFITRFGRRVRKASVEVDLNQINAVTAVLKKHNVDVSNLGNESKIFNDTPWAVEKKIMLLQELGATNITTESIILFQQRLILPVSLFKLINAIAHDESLGEVLFSLMNNCSFDPNEIGINEDIQMKKYLHLCLIHCIKQLLELNETEVNKLINKKAQFLIQSFRLLPKILKFLRDDVKLPIDKIVQHHYLLLSLHPDQLQIMHDIVSVIGAERTCLIISRYPPIFDHNLKDLKIIVSFLKEHASYPEKIAVCHLVRIFQITSDELSRRFDFFSKNYYTRDLLKHNKFFNLVSLYHCVVPRLRYLEEQNLQYCTIHSLTNFSPNYHKHLAIFKSLRLNDMKSFFLVNFGDDGEKSLQIFMKHPYYRYVPLISMRRSLEYLRLKFPYDVVKENSYAILYNHVDLQAVYKVVTKNPDYRRLPPNQLLSICLYTLEVKDHFSGDSVLAPGKYAESLKSNVDEAEQIVDTKES